MRKRVPAELEKGRILVGKWGSDPQDGFNGAFELGILHIISSTGVHPAAAGWEHVSVSVVDRCPTWEEMCIVKQLCWADTETVIQFHPKASEYVSHHPYTLHMWKHKGGHTLPPSMLVGPKR